MDLVKMGSLTERVTSTGRKTGYQVEVWHLGLKQHRVLSDRSRAVLQNKVVVQVARWEETWERKVAQSEARAAREAGKTDAEQLTEEAQAALGACAGLLLATLKVNDRVEWEGLKDHQPFHTDPGGVADIAYDTTTGRPLRVVSGRTPVEPVETDYSPAIGFFDRLFGKAERLRSEAAERHEAAKAEWREVVARNEARRRSAEEALAAEIARWTAIEAAFVERQREANAQVDALRSRYQQGADAEAIEEHAELVLNSSAYPDWHQIDFELAYNSDTKVLVVDYQLPSKDVLPTLAEVTYVVSRDDYREKYISARDADAQFDAVCYQIALRTLHELFEADEVNAFQAIVFNGWVEATNPATGNLERSCILSVQAGRDEFLRINLSDVDARACFKSLKGVSAAKLAGMAAVPPIAQIHREDRRFVASREVAESLNSSTNLAAIPWEDFEHLVRELFEKEFAVGGAEVRVTQASRDGGVDAVVLDPDPIRGGKIVVQAKRYTNTVGVSAVRDLYGTVMNEGANKGILVTTSDYGPDAYKFAQGKPLTLLNGGNLLSLLEKHGRSVRIDLGEARMQGR